MEEIKEWMWMLCVSAVFCGIVSSLLPQGVSGRAGKAAVALFFLCCLVRPLGQSFVNAEQMLPEMQTTQEELSQQLQEQTEELAYSMAENHIHELILTALEQQGIQALVHVQLEEDHVRVQLELSDAYRSREEEIQRLLQQSWGIKVDQFIWQEAK